MSNTGDRILDGSQFSNISIYPECGSGGTLEVSDTIYVPNIEAYDIGTGITIENTILKDGTITLNSSQASFSTSAGALFSLGGITILNSTNNGDRKHKIDKRIL